MIRDQRPGAAPGICNAVRIAGGQAALAKRINAAAADDSQKVTQQAVSLWVRQGFVPIHRAVLVSLCVERRIAPHELIASDFREILLSMVVQSPAGAAAVLD